MNYDTLSWPAQNLLGMPTQRMCYNASLCHGTYVTFNMFAGCRTLWVFLCDKVLCGNNFKIVLGRDNGKLCVEGF